MSMYTRKQNDSIWIGLMIGATIPVIGFFMVEVIFGFMENIGIMDEVSISSGDKRQRTMALIAICFNIIPLQFLVRRRYDALIRGILIATFIYCAAWVYLFRHGLFF